MEMPDAETHAHRPNTGHRTFAVARLFLFPVPLQGAMDADCRSVTPSRAHCE